MKCKKVIMRRFSMRGNHHGELWQQDLFRVWKSSVIGCLRQAEGDGKGSCERTREERKPGADDE